MREKRDLLRVVRMPDGTVAIDRGGKAPGRGAYVCDSPACRAAAATKGALARALAVPIPDALRAELLGGTATPKTTTMDEGGARGQE